MTAAQRIEIARRAAELAAIHAAVCRWRRQGAVCNACRELNERAERLQIRQPVLAASYPR